MPSASSSYLTDEYALAGATTNSITITQELYDSDYDYLALLATGTGDYYGSSANYGAENYEYIKISTRSLRLNDLEIIDGDEVTTIDSGTGTTIGLRTVYPGYVINATPDPEDATVTYQWYLTPTNSSSELTDEYALQGATSPSITITQELYDSENDYLVLVATGTGDYYGSSATYGAENYEYIKISARSLTLSNVSNQESDGTDTNYCYVGQELSATVSPEDAKVTYQWYRTSGYGASYCTDETAIAGATTNTYKATVDDVGYYVQLVATGYDEYYGSTACAYKTSTYYYSYIRLRSLSVTLSIDESGNYPYVGSTLTATPTSGSTVTYQWYRTAYTSVDYCTEETAIAGATNSTYTVTVDDAGYYIWVIVTGTDNYDGTSASAYKLSKIRSLTVSMTSSDGSYVYPGSTLTATPTSGSTVTYQWYRTSSTGSSSCTEETAIAGATNSTYTVTSDDYGYYIWVVVTGTDNYGGASASTYLRKTSARSFTLSLGKSYTYDGSTFSSLKTLYAQASSDDVTASYVWYRSSSTSTSTAISSGDIVYSDTNGDNVSSYTPTADDYGYYLHVVATGTDNYYNGSYVSTYIKLAKITASITSSTDSVTTGTVLTANTESSSSDYEYQWYKDGEEIDGATGSTYTVTADDAGAEITVSVSTTSGSSGSSSYTLSYGSSDSVSVKKSSSSSTSSKVTSSSGTISLVGSKVTVSTTDEDNSGDEVTATYQWYRDGDEIVGATDASYELTDEDVGSVITVTVTGTGDYSGYSETLSLGTITDGSVTNPEDSKESVDTETINSADESNIASEGAVKTTEVYASQSSIFTIKIPKLVTLDGQTGEGGYDIVVNGDIPGNHQINVTPEVTSIALSTEGKDDITATIDQSKTGLNIAEDGTSDKLVDATASGDIEASNLTAGIWKGSFDFIINVSGTAVANSQAGTE